MAIKARFKGKGTEYLNGVPARDLDEDDLAALDPETRKLVRSSDLYEVADSDKKGAKA